MEDILIKKEAIQALQQKLMEMDKVMQEHQIPLAMAIGMLMMAQHGAISQTLTQTLTGESNGATTTEPTTAS